MIAVTTPLRTAAALLDFQMWCWGQDIVHPDGNLLRARTERRRPDGGRGGSHYRATLAGGCAIVLWGFAVLVDDASAPPVVLRRHGFSPRLLDRDRVRWPITRPEQLPRGTPPRSDADRLSVRRALSGLARWIAAYERDIADRLGPGWRQECARRRPRALRHRLRCAPDALAEAWDAMALEHRDSPPLRS